MLAALNKYHDPEELKRLIAYFWCLESGHSRKVGKVRLPLLAGQRARFAAAIDRASQEIPNVGQPAGVREPISHLALVIGQALTPPAPLTAFHVADFLLVEAGFKVSDPLAACGAFRKAVLTGQPTEIVKCMKSHWS